MRRKLVAGNWKSNGCAASAKALAEAVASGCAGLRAEVVICPPFVFLPAVVAAVAQSEVRVGAQNVSESGAGAYTGEVHAEMLADIGCEFVIVGHSERRSMLGETGVDVAHKLARAVGAGLRPILCVGETLEQRTAGSARDAVLDQLDSVLAHVQVTALSAATIAYEPVWAIGTGQNRYTGSGGGGSWVAASMVAREAGAAAEDVRLLYGGSVTPLNAENLFSCEQIDGALVGGASLNPKDFLAICRSASFLPER